MQHSFQMYHLLADYFHLQEVFSFYFNGFPSNTWLIYVCSIHQRLLKRKPDNSKSAALRATNVKQVYPSSNLNCRFHAEGVCSQQNMVLIKAWRPGLELRTFCRNWLWTKKNSAWWLHFSFNIPRTRVLIRLGFFYSLTEIIVALLEASVRILS